jgi:hypothetical protein
MMLWIEEYWLVNAYFTIHADTKAIYGSFIIKLSDILVELGFESRALHLQSRDSTTNATLKTYWIPQIKKTKYLTSRNAR